MSEIKRLTTSTTGVNSEGGVLNMLRTQFTNLSKRGQIGLEFLTTERTYCKTLEDTIKNYLMPLRAGACPTFRKPLLPIIFLNIEEILAKNSLFMKELEYCVYAPSFAEKGELAPAFPPLLKALGCYSNYVKNHWRAIVEVNKWEKKDKEFAQFLQTGKELMESKLDLLSCLITPVQRVPRYRLLLADLIKHTDDSHPDKPVLEDTLKQISDLAENVNGDMRRQENLQKQLKLQRAFVGTVNFASYDRTLLKEGQLMKRVRYGSNKARWFFLFNDCLIYAKTVQVPGFIDTYEGHIFSLCLTMTNFFARPSSSGSGDATAFDIGSSQKSFTVFAETPAERDSWIHAIQSVSTGDLNAAPVWIPDSDTACCLLCLQKFTLTNRRHHCRNCGQVVCGQCSTHFVKLSHLNISSEPVRVCDRCAESMGISVVKRTPQGNGPEPSPRDRRHSQQVQQQQQQQHHHHHHQQQQPGQGQAQTQQTQQAQQQQQPEASQPQESPKVMKSARKIFSKFRYTMYHQKDDQKDDQQDLEIVRTSLPVNTSPVPIGPAPAGPAPVPPAMAATTATTATSPTEHKEDAISTPFSDDDSDEPPMLRRVVDPNRNPFDDDNNNDDDNDDDDDMRNPFDGSDAGLRSSHTEPKSINLIDITGTSSTSSAVSAASTVSAAASGDQTHGGQGTSNTDESVLKEILKIAPTSEPLVGSGSSLTSSPVPAAATTEMSALDLLLTQPVEEAKDPFAEEDEKEKRNGEEEEETTGKREDNKDLDDPFAEEEEEKEKEENENNTTSNDPFAEGAEEEEKEERLEERRASVTAAAASGDQTHGGQRTSNTDESVLKEILKIAPTSEPLIGSGSSLTSSPVPAAATTEMSALDLLLTQPVEEAKDPFTEEDEKEKRNGEEEKEKEEKTNNDGNDNNTTSNDPFAEGAEEEEEKEKRPEERSTSVTAAVAEDNATQADPFAEGAEEGGEKRTEENNDGNENNATTADGNGVAKDGPFSDEKGDPFCSEDGDKQQQEQQEKETETKADTEDPFADPFSTDPAENEGGSNDDDDNPFNVVDNEADAEGQSLEDDPDNPFNTF